MKSLLSVVGPSTPDPQNPLSTSLERRASFWNFARADYQAAYVNHTQTLLDTEDLQMWQSCGLQVTSAESLYFDAESIKSDACYRSSTNQLVAHTLLWILLRTMNYLAAAAASPWPSMSAPIEPSPAPSNLAASQAQAQAQAQAQTQTQTHLRRQSRAGSLSSSGVVTSKRRASLAPKDSGDRDRDRDHTAPSQFQPQFQRQQYMHPSDCSRH